MNEHIDYDKTLTEKKVTWETCTASLAISPELALIGVGALEMLGVVEFFGLNVASLEFDRSVLSFLGLNDQARLTAELGMRLAGIQCSCFKFSLCDTNNPLPSMRFTISSSPALNTLQSAASFTRAPGATCE